MWKGLENNRGLALILTVLIIGLLVPFTLQFQRSVWSDLDAASVFRENMQLNAIARSGCNYALAVLREDLDESEFDSLNEGWADPEAVSSGSEEMFSEGRFKVRIVDHSGKIQINALIDQRGRYRNHQRSILKRFLSTEVFGLSTEEVDNLIDALKDWLDSDSETTGLAAEDTYYASLSSPYPCRDGPIESLDELLLVRGFTKDLLYGTEEKPGIAPFVSLYGDGRININTADVVVLSALSDQMDVDTLGALVRYRMDRRNELDDPTWYQQVPEMSGIQLDPYLLTTSSTYFEVRSEGIKGSMRKRITALVERKTDAPLEILAWRVQ